LIAELRKRFEASWSPTLYSRFLSGIEQRAGTPVGFRLLESPVFLPPELLDTMIRYGMELYGQIESRPEYRAASDVAIPEQFRVPGEPEHPLFMQADFGIVRGEGGEWEPKLVEIQGFPSLYGFQAELAEQYAETFALREQAGVELRSFLGGHSPSSFAALMKRAILGQHAPEHVVLLEIDPYRQKTLADFLATQRLCGIRIVDVMAVQKRGNKLYADGIEIKRIYNRVIADELVRKNLTPAFRFTDELEVEWAGHPNWFYRLSKFSLPYFRHPCVPRTWFLHEMEEWPAQLERYVLKPLYSFAGTGVVIGPQQATLDAIPPAERPGYILQERLDFVPTVNTPEGPTKVEVRIMYVRDGNEYSPVNTVIRTGRGKMMGVDFNRDLTWVGASAGFYPVV
jgi:hypothetical protein